MLRLSSLILLFFLTIHYLAAQRISVREMGLEIGVVPTGPKNAIIDVAGVAVGHTTLVAGDSLRTGVTAILPHNGNLFQEKVSAAIYVGNGFGKLTGATQVEELGNLETPIVLTNTLSVATAVQALTTYTLQQPENSEVRSVNAVVGETNDGFLNDIRGRHVTEKDVLDAISQATSDSVIQGNVGAGTGTVCFGFKGGIGTSSRQLPDKFGGYTVGVLVQTNFGGDFMIKGVPVGATLNPYWKEQFQQKSDGSCMIVVATDAPLSARNLKRLAKRAVFGLARTGGVASNGSGDYVIAFSTASRIVPSDVLVEKNEVVKNENMTPLFWAAIEATEEAILNSIFLAETMYGQQNHVIKALPLNEVKSLMKKHGYLPSN
ncbi:P1 family peptidase [Tunicatimonas pelagia]|uniref:DmpA family aminopeptidase n=1 Tax=Tunicatimonas pelagia TaxID=931531 RepID=UPI002666E193|nr:P1 family peptidase [Tunicatimonas pelagia]WKN42681.1 P1 family peptidase [Tunicatimonas pelagia]